MVLGTCLANLILGVGKLRPVVTHFTIFGGPLATLDEDQYFAVFLCCAARNWDYNRILEHKLYIHQ